MDPISNLTHSVHIGRDLGYELRGKSAAQRAVFAVRNGDGDLYIHRPTKTQRAKLFGISTRSLAAACALPAAERERVWRGLRKLVEPQDRKAVVRTDADVVRLINEVGCDRVFAVLDKITQPMMFEAAE